MIRLFIAIVNIILALSLGSMFSENVTTKVEVPESVMAGDVFTVKCTIEKGALSGFSRFHHELPLGLKAVENNSENGNFVFEEQKAKILWFGLPSKPRFTFSYDVKVDKRLKGDFELKGNFAYIENNQRRSVQFDAPEVIIKPNPNVDKSFVIDIDEFADKVTPDLIDDELSMIKAIRQTPYMVKSSGNIIVNLLVHKNNKGKYAKLEEKIPAGYNASAIDAKSGIFINKRNTLKFLWMDMPPGEHFVVSYKLSKPAEQKTSLLNIDGNFSFIHENETRMIPVIQEDRDLTGLTDNEVEELVDKLQYSKGSATQSVEFSYEEEVEDVRDSEPETSEDEKAQDSEVTEIKPEESVKADKNKPESLSSQYNAEFSYKKYLLKPENGVYYRVQIAAGHRIVNIKEYFRKHRLEHDIRYEKHEGWFKYSIGSFNVYKKARDYRVKIWGTTSIDDAFVSAYNSGKRITVQEALMISNQKWYK